MIWTLSSGILREKVNDQNGVLERFFFLQGNNGLKKDQQGCGVYLLQNSFIFKREVMVT